MPINIGDLVRTRWAVSIDEVGIVLDVVETRDIVRAKVYYASQAAAHVYLVDDLRAIKGEKIND